MIVYMFLAIWVFILLFLLITVVKGFSAMIAVGPIPTHKKGIDIALEFVKIKEGEKFYDLGCGDGRVLVEVVKKYNCRGIGYELVFPYYLLAKLRASFLKKSKNIDIKYQNFFRADVENADVIFCFLTPKLMDKVGKFLKNKKLKKNVRIISYAFSIKGIEPVKKIKHSKENWNIYLYKF